MSIQVKATRPNITKGYGISTQENGLLAWEWVDAQMEKSRNYWISTTRPNGNPHSVPVWGVWVDGVLYFGGDKQARRSQNIAANPHVSVHLESGDDAVMLEGVAEIVTDKELIKKLNVAYNAKYGLPIGDPDADPTTAGAFTYGVKPKVVLAWLEKDYPNTATKWKFGE